MQWVAVAGAALGVAGSIKGGSQEQKLREKEADEARREGRVAALRYKQEANELLKRSMEVQGASRARAAAGGIDPFSGSAAFVEQLSETDAIEDVKLLEENAVLAREGAGRQSDILIDAGRYARRRGLLGAASAIGQGAYSYRRLSG